MVMVLIVIPTQTDREQGDLPDQETNPSPSDKDPRALKGDLTPLVPMSPSGGGMSTTVFIFFSEEKLLFFSLEVKQISKITN